MIRRTLLLTLILAACRRDAREEASPKAVIPRSPRDVVLVTIDTLRYDAVGFDGNRRGTTPNLDRFAAEGRVFTAAHAHNVVTLPSHVNILTGLYPYEHGIRDNAGFRLSPRVETLAKLLKARGYATAAFVGAFPLDSRYGLTTGFDVYDEVYGHKDEAPDFQMQEAKGDVVVGAAETWWRSQEGKRRFLWVHLYDPHAPYEPPEPYKGRFRDDAYLGEVALADSVLAPLLESVRSTSPAPLLIVTGDHGEARGDHGEITHSLFAYEATLHVPLFLWCRDLVPPGRDGTLARHVDILPTALDAVGAPVPNRLQGRSLLSRPASEPPEGAYFEALSASLNRGWAPLRGILTGGYKFIDLPVAELYDLRADPSELRNLAPARPDPLRRLRKRLLEIPAASPERGTIGSEETARLRSLGYLAGSAEPKTSWGPAEDPKNLIEVDRQLHKIVELYEKKRTAEAMPLARRVVAENPGMKMGYLQLAALLQDRGDLAGAVRVFEQATINGAGGESMDRRRAMLLAEMGRTADAARVLSAYRKTEDLETLNDLGIVLTDSGRPEEGLRTLARALEIDPRNALALQNSGIALLKLGRVDEARRRLEEALAVGHRRPRAWNALGVAWKRLGSPQKAIEAWRQCVALDPTQYDALYNLGRVAGEVGNWTLAREALERFVATAPASRYARDIREVRAVLAEMRRSA